MTEERIQDSYNQTSTARNAGGREGFNRDTRETSMNQGQSMNNKSDMGKSDQLTSKLRQTWSGLSNEDIALYTSGGHDQFFDRLEEEHGLSRDEAEEKIAIIKQSCGCSSNKAA